MLRSTAFFAASLVCVAAMPAAAIDVNEFKIACKHEYAEDLAKGDACAIKKMSEEADRLNKLAAQVRKKTENVRYKIQCKKFIIDGVEARRFTREQVAAAFGGEVTDEIIEAKSCDVAHSLGF